MASRRTGRWHWSLSLSWLDVYRQIVEFNYQIERDPEQLGFIGETVRRVIVAEPKVMLGKTNDIIMKKGKEVCGALLQVALYPEVNHE